MTEREFALDVVRKLQQAGFAALWAGGCVRDELLGLTPADYDVATNARPDQLRPLFKRRNEIGASFGVVQVIGPKSDEGEWLTIEVATFRSDVSYSDGRRPDAVVFSSPEEDAKRRDFTINGMFFDPVKNELIDYVGGRADLDAKVLRAISNPFERFTEDKLRILRAVRIATRFDLAIDPATLAAGQRMAAEIRAVSPERIAEELRKLLTHPNRTRGVRLLREFGLVGPVLPELASGEQWERAVRVVERLEQPNPPAPFPKREGGGRQSPLSAKPDCAAGAADRQGRGLGGGVSFPLVFAALVCSVSKSAAEDIADRLRFSTAEKTRVAWLVEKHVYLTNAPTMRLSQLKTILVHPGIRELLALHRAEALANGASLEPVEFCERMLRDTPAGELNPPPVLTGEDLIATGLKPGPEFKRLLDAVREAQLEGRVKSKEEALAMVQELRTPPAPETLSS